MPLRTGDRLRFAELWKRSGVDLFHLQVDLSCQIDQTCQRSYRNVSYYSADGIRQITSYLPDGIRQITSSLIITTHSQIKLIKINKINQLPIP